MLLLDSFLCDELGFIGSFRLDRLTLSLSLSLPPTEIILSDKPHVSQQTVQVLSEESRDTMHHLYVVYSWKTRQYKEGRRQHVEVR